jgi:hypothetical protein
MPANELQTYNISEKYKSIIWLPERTGSGTNAKIMSLYDFKCNGGILIDGNRYNYTHTCIMDPKYEDYIKICTTRNPYSRVVSIYKSLGSHPFQSELKNKDNFKKYLKWIENKDLTDITFSYITNPRMEIDFDYLIRLENIEEDYKKIPFISEVLTDTELKEKLSWVKPIEKWEHFYDPENKEIVLKLCEKHFEMWDYEK